MHTIRLQVSYYYFYILNLINIILEKFRKNNKSTNLQVIIKYI
jgi:hypothetical protein